MLCCCDIYIFLQLEGNVFVVYNLGTVDNPVGDISVKVNDNAYHVVRFHRTGHNSTLQVDDYNVQTSFPSGNINLLLNEQVQYGNSWNVYNYCGIYLAGHQLQVFNSQSQIQVGGKWGRGKSRIERPFTGIISGVVVNGLRVLDLAAEKDIHASIRGDVQLISGILDRHDHLQKMQQVHIPIRFFHIGYLFLIGTFAITDASVWFPRR